MAGYLNTSEKDFMRSYVALYKMYNTLKDSEIADKFKRSMILVYCVECGLKYVLMKEEYKVSMYCDIDKKDRRRYGHNIREILNDIPDSIKVNFRDFHTNYHDVVNIKNYHEVCRYSISLMKNDTMFATYEENLLKIAEWIKEKLNIIM